MIKIKILIANNRRLFFELMESIIFAYEENVYHFIFYKYIFIGYLKLFDHVF
jgi:hypothetical protein